MKNKIETNKWKQKNRNKKLKQKNWNKKIENKIEQLEKMETLKKSGKNHIKSPEIRKHFKDIFLKYVRNYFICKILIGAFGRQ
mgnify:CR=1 FL=1